MTRKRYKHEWYVKNVEKTTKRSMQWAKDNPERIKEINRKHKFGISPEEYDLKSKKQKNRCAICGKKETHRDHRSHKLTSLSVDHDHKTGKIRDLLCRNCNRVLGLFSDNATLFKKVIQYLKKHNKE